MRYPKRKHCILTVCLCMLPVALVFLYILRPTSDYITLDGLEMAVEAGCSYARVEERYYELDGANDLAQLLQLDRWRRTSSDASSAGQLLVTLHFGELYELSLYDTGIAIACFGYSAPWEKSSAAYIASPETAQRTVEYVLENGVEETRHEVWYPNS